MYICTHRHYCTYVYATSTQLPLWVQAKKYCSCAKKLQFCVWLPRRNGRKIQTNSQTAQTQMGFRPQGQLLNVPSSFAGIKKIHPKLWIVAVHIATLSKPINLWKQPQPLLTWNTNLGIQGAQRIGFKGQARALVLQNKGQSCCS